MRQALTVVGLLSLILGVELLAARAVGFAPGTGRATRAAVAVVLATWLAALAVGVLAAFQRRNGSAPRARTRYAWTLPAIVMIVLLMPVVIQGVTMARDLTALLVSVPSTAFALWTVHRMQRYRRIPVWLTLAMFGWGAIVASGFASTTNFAFTSYAFALARHGARIVVHMPQLPSLGLWVHVGVIEELGKVAGAAMAYALARRHVDGVVSGIVIGAAVGLGFNFIETIAYMSSGNAANQYWLRQSVGLMASHTAYSAVAGAGFGVARQLREPSLRRIAIACGFLVAASGHFAANTVSQWFGLARADWPSFSPAVDVFVVSPLQIAVMQGPMVVMYLLLLRRGLRSQAAGLAAHLPAEARTGLGAVTAAEVPVLLSPARRLRLKLTVLRRYGIGAYRNLNRLQAAQLDLGTQRWHRARQEVDDWAPNERVLRERVWSLKDRQATLMTARPQLTEALA